MATNKLTEVAIKKAKSKEKMYKLSDGGGLYLQVMPNGSNYFFRQFARKMRFAKLELAEGNDLAASKNNKN